ncbi:hypothetical protein LOZ53_003376 [Ophidiomyces ophidiicola]|uniref:Uncharacterized protein n=1 Tax=Ophidiomyces ophidiicola TaxID=1387563 RepID=A0ACB8V481_9EURO|nr:uncharacterized protein LOZ57_005577 [Ophidiomyces ophidiicola]KAI1907712.1 hypothetical protein LOZ61_005964 [Ophidiomyces ophidiicola]KAI1924017.1 hypothetical protein LOZ64_000759 [Ophidiomyces ophidiicola]KAI1927831.1 hypothetical protein LOZ60_002796 [Ophidiomyces ophidiicola]KAI1941592.1 hypothetical protein LOZ57_005577 [Ophidiomyces ophidiicola]KAI1948724.1 hypothetical protein LOZ62_002539 [Ophidiomyces ophidiicola]
MAQNLITDTDKSALVDIFVWIFLVVAVLAVIASIATKLAIRRHLTTEDYIILASVLLATGQSIAVGIQNTNGWGKYVDSLSKSQLETVLKADYAATILFILAICLTKISLLVLNYQFALLKQYKYTIYCLGGIVILWTASSILVVSFQCDLPRPWDYINNVCLARKNFWNFYGVLNMVSDIIQLGLMLMIITQIQTSTRRKITIASVFACRLFVVVAVALQLYFLNQVQNTKNATFDYWRMSICTQIVQALAVVTACIPFLKPFLDSLESGLLRADDQYRRSTKGSYRYNLSGSKASGKKATRKDPDDFNELGVLSSKRGRARHGHGTQVESGVVDWDECNSQSSQSRIIKETRTFTVDVEVRSTHQQHPGQ